MNSYTTYRGYSIWPIRFRTHVWTAEIRLRSGLLVHTLGETYPSQRDAIRAAQRWIDAKVDAERHERAMRRNPPRPPAAMLMLAVVLLAGALLLAACAADAGVDGVQAIRLTATAIASAHVGQPVPTETPAAMRTPEPTATVAISPQTQGDDWLLVAGVFFVLFLSFATWLGKTVSRIAQL